MKEKPEGAWAPEEVAEYLEEKMAQGSFYVICPDNDVSQEKDKKRMLNNGWPSKRSDKIRDGRENTIIVYI